MKLKHIKTFIFLTIFVVFAGGLIYNIMKQPSEAPEIVRLLEDSSPGVHDSKDADAAASIEPFQNEDETGDPDQSSGLVNINTAGQAELESLPGIGPVKAKAIIEYRRAYKGFKASEEIMEVRGIGKATYNKIKDLITLE